MTIKSSQDLVNNALKEIKTITSDEAAKIFKKNKCNLIDIRDIRELERDGSCLLYTSPSPRDLDLSRMPSSA